MKLSQLIGCDGFEINLEINGNKYHEEQLDYSAYCDEPTITFWDTRENSWDLICVVRNNDINPSSLSYLYIEGILPSSDNDEECMVELLSTGKLISDDTGEDITEELSEYYKLAAIKIFFTKSAPATTEEIAAEFLVRKL